MIASLVPSLMATPAFRLASTMLPPTMISMPLVAVMLPALKLVPAAAWKLPVETGPVTVIDPSVGTGANGNTRFGLKLSTPPAAMNIDASAR